MIISNDTALVKNTTFKVVLPFYAYAALSFLMATVLLLFSSNAFTSHYFHPQTLAITHLMALGWGTMIILGASHQLVPVLIEAKLHSNFLAYCSFFLAGTGIPLLVYSFLIFQFNWLAQTGAILINAAIICYLVNLALSMANSKHDNVHATFVFTAAAWLLVTTLIGGTLIYNFSYLLLQSNSLHYLSLHAHIGIAGWFLLMIIGIGSRLIPMFLISKYDEPKKLWPIYFIINAALFIFIILFITSAPPYLLAIPVAGVLTAILLFGSYCYKAYKQRIRKKTDPQVRISLLSVAMLVLPLLLLAAIWMMPDTRHSTMVLAYGFTIFFGWITALILGMTFKTLPFIVWNKVYHISAGSGKTPNPKDLFSKNIFTAMRLCYLSGFVIFIAGLLCVKLNVIQAGTVLLLIAAVLYNWNVIKILLHKPNVNE